MLLLGVVNCESHRGNKTHNNNLNKNQTNMLQKLNKNRGGFTLVEIMIVVAIIALISAIAVPNFLRARKRTQATLVKEDLRVLEYALDRWAIEQNKTIGDVASFTDLRPYLKTNTSLYTNGKDVL